MFHVLVLGYTVPKDQVEPHVAEHVKYLERYHGDGTFVLSGQTVPTQDGGVILATGLDRAGIETVAASDPFLTAGVAEYVIITITPGRVHRDLADLVATPSATESGWDAESFRQLRVGTGAVFLLASRPLTPVLQHAGRALLADHASGTRGSETLIRNCIRELEQRSWEGDDQLALELRNDLGEPVSAGEYGVPAWPLETVPVNPADLADYLDGRRDQGQGAVDLREGTVWPPGISDYDPPPEMNEDSDDYDEDRWLFYSPDSGDAYHDMLDFTDHVQETLRGRLLEALDGRGAFRRFADIMHREPDDVLTRWRIFSQERAIGRARAWLASNGFRPAP
jgi:uncharacterized protein YciI